MSVDTIVLRAMETKCTTKGQSFRMKHEVKMDGSICTEPHKDPAMTITRDTGGWVWHCHRCNESGYIGDKFVNPDSTLQKLDQIKDTPVPKVTYIVRLPSDFIPLVEKVGDNSYFCATVPLEATDWLWKYGIFEKEIHEFGFGWSEMYQMVILPLHSSDKRVLTGWIGRRVIDKTKGKYHIQKPKGNKDRLYFTVKGKEDNKIILVEDCISAIKVNKSTGVTTTALLTTSIDENMTRRLRGMEVYVWLDADALAKSVAMVTRFRQLGIEAKHIYTSKDPKCYNCVAIKDLWNQSVKEV